ncbi:14630_t:CDS:10 [Gigaspora rosea]|nr:14630_t:CDS:10 [Gigaspora rosea]
MSNNDNKELQTELEITGGIVTFAIIVIGFITLITICAHLEKKKKLQKTIRRQQTVFTTSATASTVTTTITASSTNSIETTTSIPQYFQDINVQETLGGLLFFLITISITAFIIYNRNKAYRYKLVKHDLDKENEDIARAVRSISHHNRGSTTRTNLTFDRIVIGATHTIEVGIIQKNLLQERDYMINQEISYPKEYIIDEGHQGLEIKLLDKDYELPLGALIKKDTDQEIKEGTNFQKIEELIKKKKTQEPKSILIQNKAEIYILKEWKEAFLNKKLEPRRYPKLLELADKLDHLGETRTRKIQKEAEIYPGYTVIRQQENQDTILNGLENLILEFDGTIVKYIEWRDTVERAFTIKGITTLMIFGRYQGNPDDGYICVGKDHDGTGDAANHSQAEFVVNFNRQVFAIIATKLKGTALSNIKLMQKEQIVDRTNYPASLNQTYTTNLWHGTATRSAYKNGLTVEATTALAQQLYKFKFIPNWNNKNSYDKYMNKFEELKTLANYQYAANFKSQPYTDYKMRLPPEMKERLTFQAGLGNVQTETQFWQQTSAIFHSLRQNKVDIGKAQIDLKINRFLKKEKPTTKSIKINNVNTNKPSRTLKNNTKSQVPCDNTNKSEAFGQSGINITSSHPLERLEVPPLTRKNRPATGAQRDHKNHKPNHNQLHATGDHTVGRLLQVQGAQYVSKNNTTPTTGESRDKPKYGNQNELVAIRQTHGT